MRPPFFGAELRDGGAVVRVCAPGAAHVDLLVAPGTAAERVVALGAHPTLEGAWSAEVTGVGDGTRYLVRRDGGAAVPDPASRWQPDGVHAPSAMADDRRIPRASGWAGIAPERLVFYELHVGTFTPEGTFAAARAHLAELAALGITAIELMPIAAFPGTRGWGYDGVFWYAPFAPYGTPRDVAAFVADAHAHGIAVFLDVVYNHFGPEGNALHGLAPAFFDPAKHTPWGAAIDYAQPFARRFAVDAARRWLEVFGFDGLRLDAVHEIKGNGRRAVLREIAAAAAEVGRKQGRRIALVLENDANEAWLLRPDDAGPAYDAQWNDDLHHALHVLVTGERGGYYGDYEGEPARLLGRTLANGFGYQGEYSAHRGAARGSASVDLPPGAFVSFAQNHDQIGNRAFGERLTALAAPEAVRAAAALLLLAPQPPLLFMGEEWGASTPFLYFCDFEPALAAAVREGRAREFATFAEFADGAARATIPDATDPLTARRCVLDRTERAREPHASLLALHDELLALRAREIAPRAATLRGGDGEAEVIGGTGLRVRWRCAHETLEVEANLSHAPLHGLPAIPHGRVLFATHPDPYGGGAPPWSIRWSVA